MIASGKPHFFSIWALLLALGTAFGAEDSVPYARIAMPIPDSGVDQRIRDVATLKFGRVRVNQAGYRRVDDSLGMAKFYYVSRAIPVTAFSVIDTATKLVIGTGTMVDKGFKSGSKMSIWASNWAGLTSGGDVKYKLTSDGQGTTIAASQVYEGTLPTNLQEGHYYRVIVGTDTSVAFLVSNNLYGHVRDALLKFMGINRSGDGPSWFNAPSHLKDRYLARPSNPGAYKGAWYDCGEHLK
ncbi:MAG: cellulase N-terminal Ig-like domain-containing protein, partial [Fibrobacterota bacterium]